MIHLTRLDGKETVVNCDQILLVEDTPDTVLTFANGTRLVVRESVADVVERTVQFRRRLQAGLAVVSARER